METEQPAPPPPTAGPALIKSLAACNASTRSKTLKSLISWLQHQHQPQPPLSDDDVKKLWKGLFYCVWHSDKAPNQLNLINRLSSLLSSLSPPLSVLYFSHFLLTLRREWPGIDRLRLDKFYLMIRVFVRTLFELFAAKKWDLEVVEKYWGVLDDRLFVCQDDEKRLGDGVTYHVVSVFCDEIKTFLPLRLEVLNVLFRPFVSVLGRTANKVLLGKLKSELFGGLIRNGKGLLEVKKEGEDIDSKDERALFGMIVAAMGFSTRFYELGSSPDCVQGNRKVLFSLHEEFARLEKDLKSAGVDVTLPVVDGDDEEVPQLIPVSNGDVQDEDVDVQPKKKKKKKDKGASKDDKQEKKKKKKKKITENGVDAKHDNENPDMDIETANDGEKLSVSVDNDSDDEPDSPNFDDAILSNLQKQFELVAAESGLDDGVSSSMGSPTNQGNGEVSKKRKRAKKAKGKKILQDTDLADAAELDVGDDSNVKTGEKSGKKVKFSMKNNLVWNPASPLPPQSVRIPPSVTPRGSALKKGVRPGPIREMSSKVKKRASPSRRKVIRSKSPAIKRKKKVSMSA